MKISKEARQISRQLFRLSFTERRLDRGKVSSLMQSIIVQKPRHYLGALHAYERLIRLEVEKRHAVIESALPLSDETGASIVASLKQKHGDDLTSEFTVNPGLIGGLRIKIGSDVWDGSVRNRLAALAEQF